ncbi:ABC transporter permease subunit [Thermoactinospora rubra]|uniref:ABC transporter permease subunit n=1 Tax=Thermoactinospora rubra TaxID=1088767 RepID=UPI000A0F7BDF|nr:ABC transporter permease subunit [Thermoactinospora rubra]
MTTQAQPAIAARPDSARFTFGDAVRAEWTKFRSVRSFRWCLAIFALISVLTSAGFAVAAAMSLYGAETATMGELVSTTQLGMGLAELVILVLGILTITGEYRSGTIRTSLMSVPRRWHLLLAKALVLAAAVAVASQVAAWAAFGIQYASSETIGDLGPEMLRVLFGYAPYLAVLAVFGMAIGAVVRHAAGAILAGIGVVYVLPFLAGLVPHIGEWADEVLPYPSGTELITMTSDDAWVWFGVCCAWTVVVLALAIHLTHRRDA